MIGLQADSNRMKQFSKNKKRLIKMLITTVVAFALTWLPVHLIHFFNFYIVTLLPKSCNSGETLF